MIVPTDQLFPPAQRYQPVIVIPPAQPSFDPNALLGFLKLGAAAIGLAILLDPGCRGQCRRLAETLWG